MRKNVIYYLPYVTGARDLDGIKSYIKTLTLNGVVKGYREFVIIDKDSDIVSIMKIKYFKESNSFVIR